jgi:hypothetical protein
MVLDGMDIGNRIKEADYNNDFALLEKELWGVKKEKNKRPLCC